MRGFMALLSKPATSEAAIVYRFTFSYSSQKSNRTLTKQQFATSDAVVLASSLYFSSEYLLPCFSRMIEPATSPDTVPNRK